MAQKIAPLNPLRVFWVVGRSTSFTDAAQELLVTQAAVSRQIGVLEDYFGTKLFDRDLRVLTLTPAGRRLHREIGPAFEAITWATSEMLQKQNANAVTLQTYPTFGSLWLIPKVAALLGQEPKFVLNIKSAIRPADYNFDAADLCIRIVPQLPSDADGFRICGDRIAPVCIPSLRTEMQSPESVLKAARLITTKYRHSDWTDWARAANFDMRGALFMNCDSSLLAYQAALAGAGIAMAQLELIESYLASRVLVAPFGPALERDHAYWCIWPKQRRLTKPARLFVDWLRAQVPDGTPQRRAR